MADRFGNLVILAQLVQDQIAERRGHAGRGLAEVQAFDRVVFAQQEHMAIGPPDGFLQIGLGAPQALRERAALRLFQLPSGVFIRFDVFPGEHVPRGFRNGRAMVRRDENQAGFVSPARRATFSQKTFNEFQGIRVLRGMIQAEHDQGQLGPVRHIVRLGGEAAPIHPFAAALEQIERGVLDTVFNVLLLNRAPARDQHLVEIRAQAEPVAVAIPVQVETLGRETLQHGFHIGQVEIGMADRRPNFGHRGFHPGLALPAVTLEEDRCGDPLVETGFLDRVYRFPVQADGMSLLLAGNIGRDRYAELLGTELLKQRITEGLIRERRGTEGDQRFP